MRWGWGRRKSFSSSHTWIWSWILRKDIIFTIFFCFWYSLYHTQILSKEKLHKQWEKTVTSAINRQLFIVAFLQMRSQAQHAAFDHYWGKDITLDFCTDASIRMEFLLFIKEIPLKGKIQFSRCPVIAHESSISTAEGKRSMYCWYIN